MEADITLSQTLLQHRSMIKIQQKPIKKKKKRRLFFIRKILNIIISDDYSIDYH